MSMGELSALPPVCVCIGHRDEARAATVAVENYVSGQTFLELRIDMLADPARGGTVVRRVLNEIPGAHLLATCRRTPNGGRFDGSIESQVSILRSAVRAGATIVDIEIETVDETPRSLDGFRDAAATLVSYHNFRETPTLGPVLTRLRKTQADILKVATRVHRPSDNLRLLALCDGSERVVVAGMGETGAPTRLLAPSRGALFTYAGPDAPPDPDQGANGARTVAPTAPGQFPSSAVRDLYRVQAQSVDTRVYAVIAKPVAHSKSPLIHNRAFHATGFDGIYLPLLVDPSHLEDFVAVLRSLPIAGASVTIPHKQSIVPFLDAVDPLAESIGAVNTVYWQDGKLVGANTDAAGITVPLSRRRSLQGARVLVMGNGGAAKAAVVALAAKGCAVTVTGRNTDRVVTLALQHGAEPVAFDDLDGRYFDVLIQATPVGMLPAIEDNLFPGRVPADIVFDLVYNPLETALLQHARREGRTVISGIEMFVEQAAAQFGIWTGLAAPREIMRHAVLGRTVK